MNINANISLFRSYMDPVPVLELSIYQFFQNVVACDYCEEVAQVRAGRLELKKRLPGVTVSGTFTRRNNESLIKHSGFIALDIDGKDNPTVTDWQGLRDTLGTWHEVLMAALSVSGKGLFLIIPLAYPHNHREQYLALEKDFAAFGLVTDRQCKDVSRLRGISSDAQATWNPQAKPYKKQIIEPKPYHGKPKASPELSKLVEWVERTHGGFTEGNRNNFITHLAGAAHRFGVSQAEVESHLLGYQQGGFTEREILATIRTIYNNKRWESVAN